MYLDAMAQVDADATKMHQLIAYLQEGKSVDVALERNRNRPRSLPDKEVEKMWKDVQKNLD